DQRRGRRRHPADLPRAAADERVPRGRGGPRPDGRGSAVGRSGAGGAALQGAEDPGGRAVSGTTAAELAAELAAGTVTSVEATRKHLDRIAEVDGQVHAFL